MNECDLCGRKMEKVIYMGLPGRLCMGEDCHLLIGLAAWAPPIVSETERGPRFAFLCYEGSYWRALWYWLIGSK